MVSRHVPDKLLSSIPLLLSLACSAGEAAEPGSGAGESSVGQGGAMVTAQGGSGNASAQGGSSSQNGGSANPTGGSANPTGGSANPTGGSANPTGGSAQNGGAASSSGGANPSNTGGTLTTGTGGGANGGTSAGATMGGTTATGGITNGGSGGGGKAAGGNAGMGGKASGGTTSTGGTIGTGGTTNSGGKASGGTSTGGTTATGGSGGSATGAWTSGYVATMYGDINSGDCVAYSSKFTDHTPIKTYTCVDGTGPRKVTLASYSAGQANNASYYAALGDLSSLWTVNGNASACTCSGSTTTTCGGPQCTAEISSTGSCGVCVAVKCDPNSTFKDNQGYSHNSNCNTTSYVVVQNIDACPHNHTTNVASAAGWCTSKQSQHIDLSCSGLGDISNLGTNVGQAGWLPVSVQVVDCNVGLGKHSL